MARAGRRPGPTTTGDDVLRAARTLFAERGYHATTVRAIAAAARVTPAMVHHFFRSKHAVFLASIRMPLDPAQLLSGMLSGPREQFPERLVRTFVGVWRSEVTGPSLRSVLRSAITDDEQAAAMRAFASTVVIPRAAAGLDVAPERIVAALSIMIGQAVARTMIAFEALADLDDDQVVELYVPAVRAALFG
ncbi:MAG: TetR family transcriptional regulator [Jatrophihabitantaceae bacterium]